MVSLARRLYRGDNPARAISIADLQAMAHRRLPVFVREYIEGGAEDEITLGRNREAFDGYAFAPRVLTGVADPDLTVKPFAVRADLPLAIAPTGFAGLLRRDGDLALARAAAASGVPFIQSTVSNASMETVAAASGPPWFQLYVFRSRDIVLKLVERAARLGCPALVVTVDATTFGNREWDRRNYRRGTDPTMGNKIDMLLHPHWLIDVFGHGLPGFANLHDVLPPSHRGFTRSAAWTRAQTDPSLDWEALSWLRSLWNGPLVVKGLATADDVQRAVDVGADGVVLSNHGGRQLDGGLSPLSILPQVAARMKGKTTIFVDSGFRRGADVVKALALGADGVLIGRAALYGLAAAGEAGVVRALAILREEMARTMALLGVGAVGDLNPDCLVPTTRQAGQ